ncbi:hypothetical protein, partial [Mycoplasmoides pneumoniae]|uniref:hypothetical protein n=1 Tax=Mycoplasmoides pneumoniae TaxID=2104 RepID=UPI001F3712B8
TKVWKLIHSVWKTSPDFVSKLFELNGFFEEDLRLRKRSKWCLPPFLAVKPSEEEWSPCHLKI